MQQISTFLSTWLRHWYELTTAPMPSSDASLEQRLIGRRQRIISTILLILLLLTIAAIPIEFLGTDPLNVVAQLILAGMLGVAILCNRHRMHLLAGFIPVIVSELVLCFDLGTLPGGLAVADLPEFAAFSCIVLVAVLLLPPAYTFLVALGNSVIICFLLLLLPKTAELQQLLARDLMPFAIPIILQIITASLAFYGGHSALKAIKEENRADELQRLYQEQARTAITDAITGLPNHRAVMQSLCTTLAENSDAAQPHALLFIDLDHFKRINDTLGHLAGDSVLHEAGRRLQDIVGLQGTVGRYGGEEFVVVLPFTDLAAACSISEQIRETFATMPCIWQAKEHDQEIAVPVSTSIGIAVSSLHGTSPATLLEAADRAMYQSKSDGRNRVSVADLAWLEGCPENSPIPGRRYESHTTSSPRNRTTEHEVTSTNYLVRLPDIAPLSSYRQP